MRAVNAGGESDLAPRIDVTTDATPTNPPATPTGLSEDSTTPTSITISWTASTGANSYTVRLDGTETTGVTGTTHTFTSLSPGTTYAIAVAAVNTDGSSSFTANLSVTTDAIPAPATPTGLTEDSTSQNSISVSWNTTPGAVSYTARLDGTQTAGITGTSHTFTGLAASTTYQIAVAAVGPGGTSAFTNNLSISTDAAPPPPPPATAIIMSSLAVFQAAFTGEQTGSGGRWAFDNAGSTSSSQTGPGTNNTDPFVYTETSSSTTTAQMQINGQAEFAAVPAQTGRTLTLRMCIQGTPFSLSATSGMHIQHRASSSDSWADAGLIRGWAYLGLRNVGSTWNDYGGTTLTCVADGGWVDFTISIPNTATQVRLNPEYGSAAVNNDIALRQFSWAGSDGGAAPATPTGLSVDSKTSNSITVSWTAVPDATSYTVRLDGTETAGITGTSHTFTNLAHFTTYQIAVSAVNANGTSAFTANLPVTTDPAPVNPPATPTGLAEDSKTHNSISVSWNTTPNATAYTARLDGVQTTGITGTSYQFTGLAASTSYQIAVAAVNSDGSSAFTANLSVTTDAAPTPPATPTGLSEDSKTHNSITISWNASTGANSYTVRLDGAQTPGVSGTSHTFTGLAPSTSYAIAVAAVNTIGSSSFTANLSVTTDTAPVTPPATPTGLQEVSKTDTTITVQWNVVIRLLTPTRSD